MASHSGSRPLPEIRSNVALPNRCQWISEMKALAEKMKIGDSVFLKSQREAALLCYHLRQRGFKYAQRKGFDLEGPGLFVWCLADNENLSKAGQPSSSEGCSVGETRATFILPEEILTKIKNVAYWERRLIKDVVRDALEIYLESRTTKAAG